MYNIAEDFPVLRNQIYVNTPVFGPIPKGLYQWRQEHDHDFLMHASSMRTRTLEIISNTRTTVGSFFGCKRDNVALVTNFSTALNMLLEGLNNKHKVLLLENDYPSIDWPFMKRGFPVSYVKIDADLEANILNAVKNENISILALSVVQWQNGIKIDLDFLKRLKKEYPDVIIIADGTQFLGTTNFNFEDSAFDVLGASAYKWLLAGYGCGFMLFKDAVEQQCDLKSIGFNAANAIHDKRDEIRFARRFEPGHLACTTFGSLGYSLNYLDGIGKDKIEAHNQNLIEKLKIEFAELGLLQDAVVARENHSTVFNIKGDDELFQHLTENKVVCAQRGTGIRMGFHFYNTEAEIDAIIEILKEK